MKNLLFICLLSFGILPAQNNIQNKFSSVAGQHPTQIAVLHINVVNVIKGAIEANQTILINNGKIDAVGPFKKTKVPALYAIIDGTGKFAMPGLTDSHIHFFQSGGLYTRPDGLSIPSVYPYEKDQQWLKENLGDIMARYLACGITNVIDLGGPMGNFTIRENANRDVSSPNVLTTGPLISTLQPKGFDNKDLPIIKAATPEDGRALVVRQLSSKPDFIKIWYLADDAADAAKKAPLVKAIINESHKHHLKVCVHATEYETASLAVDAGADILVHSIEDKAMFQPLIAAMKKKKVVYIPTLQVHKNYLRTFSQRFDFTMHDFKFANPLMMGSTMDLQHIQRETSGIDYKAIRSRPLDTKKDTIIAKNLMLVRDGGILIVAGTDAGNIGTHHGSSLLKELELMKAAGMSQIEVLRSATINAAKAFGKENEWGSIDKNKTADILLLNKNPLEDLDALANIPVLIHRGIVIETQKLIPATPETIVQQQLNAYNARHLEAYLSNFSDNAEVYDLPGKILAKGKEEIQNFYRNLFDSNPDLHCELLNRTVLTNLVIDKVRRNDTGTPHEAMIAYEVEHGKITKVYLKQ